jgi:hypothetical protein
MSGSSSSQESPCNQKWLRGRSCSPFPTSTRAPSIFRDVLGFRIDWENAADWRLAERDGVRIMLGQCPKDVHPSTLGSHNWFGYLDVDGLHAEFTARGAACSAPKDTHYGMREIVVTTIDGHRLVCGQPSRPVVSGARRV